MVLKIPIADGEACADPGLGAGSRTRVFCVVTPAIDNEVKDALTGLSVYTYNPESTSIVGLTSIAPGSLYMVPFDNNDGTLSFLQNPPTDRVCSLLHVGWRVHFM